MSKKDKWLESEADKGMYVERLMNGRLPAL